MFSGYLDTDIKVVAEHYVSTGRVLAVTQVINYFEALNFTLKTRKYNFLVLETNQRYIKPLKNVILGV